MPVEPPHQPEGISSLEEFVPETPTDIDVFVREAAEAVAEASGFSAEEILRNEPPYGGRLGDARNALLVILVEDTEFSIEDVTGITNRKPNTKQDVPGSVIQYNRRMADTGYQSGFDTTVGEPLKGGPRKRRALADARFALGTTPIRRVEWEDYRTPGGRVRLRSKLVLRGDSTSRRSA